MQEEKETEKEDIWTQILTKSKRRRKGDQQHQQPTTTTLLHPINPPLKDLTLPKLSQEFHSKLKTWQQSSCRKSVLSLLHRIQPEAGWKLQKAICLGSGSLSRENWECRRRSVWQFVVFYDLAQQFLEGEGGRMFAQEPTFTELDREFLTTLGIHILPSRLGDPGMGVAGEELGEGTFLFEPFVDMNVGMLEVMLENDVGLYMGSSIAGILGRRGGSELGRLAGEFAEGREMRRFPTFEIEPNVLDGVGIYWREEAEDDEGDMA